LANKVSAMARTSQLNTAGRRIIWIGCRRSLPNLFAAGLPWIVTARATAAVLAVKAATLTIPIVFAVGADPVKAGLVVNLNRPGGNVTGVSFLANSLVAKQLQLLQEVVPAATVMG
jgi:ABC-type uncharacterized transport system substrate-binding protein